MKRPRMLAALMALALQAVTLHADVLSRLQIDEPSWAIWRFAEGDQSALRAFYSLRYTLRPYSDDGRSDGSTFNDFSFKYTGSFDFYAGTRPSGPVINRISNPGFHYRHSFPSGEAPQLGAWVMRWYNLGVEHRSNGQTTEVKTSSEIERAQRAYETGDDAYFDGVSRGANFFSVATGLDRQISEQALLSVDGKLRLYFTEDSDISWGPLAGKGVKIWDYDRLVLSSTYAFGSARRRSANELSLEWTVGDRGFSTQSFNAGMVYHLGFGDGFDLPFYLRYHIGPMATLSNYTQKQKYIGLGFKFVPD